MNKPQIDKVPIPPCFPLEETLFAAAALLAAGLLAYSNSFTGQFIYDDGFFVDYLQTHSLWEYLFTTASLVRPVVSLTLAFNYALGGLAVAGYHVFNLAVHILAALTLFGLVRRTLRLDGLRERFNAAAGWLALAVALLWLVHPLQTESVTYIVQRAEALAGLFYLLTLYCVLRGAAAPLAANSRRRVKAAMATARRSQWHQNRWYAWAIMACALGMACKPTLATAPLVVFAFDRIFLAKDAATALRRRWRLYAGLAATWLILAATLFISSPDITAGFGLLAPTPAAYAQTQFGVILHYLRLSFWPAALCFDYLWPVAHQLDEILPGAIVVGTLCLATLWAWVWRPAWSFLGVWFFIILVPTSSFMPIADPAAEHRLYLPLAALVTLAVVSAYLLGGALIRRLPLPEARRLLAGKLAAAVSMVMSAALLGCLTYSRNTLYNDPAEMWRDVANKRPENLRAYNNAGLELIFQNKYEKAIWYFTKMLELNPLDVEAYVNRSYAFFEIGDYDGSIVDCNKALELNPQSAKYYCNRGNARFGKGDYDGAIEDYNKTLELDPRHAVACSNRGNARKKKGDYDGALADYNKALELDPRCANAYINRGNTRYLKDDCDGAAADYDKVLELDPSNTAIRLNRSYARLGKGDYDGAIEDCDKMLEFNPHCAEAYSNRGCARREKRDYDGAIADCSKALELNPRCADAYAYRGYARMGKGDYDGVIADCTKALELNPQHVENCYYSRGNARYSKGDYDGAISDYTKALELSPQYVNAYNNRGVALYFKGDYDGAAADCAKAVALDRSNWETLLHNGILLLKIGRGTEARACFDAAVKIYPNLQSSLEGMIAQARAEHQALMLKKQAEK